MTDEVIIYSDGGADPNPGIGGWAAILRAGDRERVLTGHDPKTTNNRMELQAAISALRALKRPCRIQFHTDSQYLRRGITEGVAKWSAAGWVNKQGHAIPNADLWCELQTLVPQHDITWHWVRGHSGDPANEAVDRLAREARLSITPQIDLASDVPRLYLRSSCHGNPGPDVYKRQVMSPLGTAAQPLRVAIIGAGPAGFYAAERLFKETELVIEVDLYDRLPTPFGLVRNGVAPDHQKIKSVTAAFDRIAGNPRFRFFGHVELGSDVSVDELKEHYHQTVSYTHLDVYKRQGRR